MSGLISKSQNGVFTSHLFRAGCECPVKLYYKRGEKYPESRSNRLPLKHIKHNTEQLTAFLRGLYPGGEYIQAEDKQRAFRETKEKLNESVKTFYNASFLTDGLFANIPLLKVRSPEEVTSYHVYTKAIDAAGKKTNPKRWKNTIQMEGLSHRYRFSTLCSKKGITGFNRISHHGAAGKISACFGR